MKKILFPIVLCCILCVCCVRPDPPSPFIDNDRLQLVIGGRNILDYNALDCQKYYNSQENEFMVCSDDGSRYYSVKLSPMPTSEGQKTVASLEWTTTLGAVRTKNNIVLDVVKIADDKIWLWNAKQQIEACVQTIL